MTSDPISRDQRAAFSPVTGKLASGLASKVFGLLAFSFVAAGMGALVGTLLNPIWYVPLVVVELVLIFGIYRVREAQGWNVALLYIFAFVSGMTLGPIIAAYANAGLSAVLIEAVVVTAAMTIGLSLFALATDRDLTGLAPYLFMGMLGLLVASVANIWVGGSALHAAVSWAGALLFSVVLVFDVNRTRHTPDTMANAVIITLDVYLDILNLFLFLLRILSSGDD